MINRILLTVSLLLVGGTGAYMSVYGLAAVFAAAVPVAVCLGLGLELGKLMTVVHLHRRWKALPVFARTFYMGVAAVLMVITASEAAGFLLQSYTRDTAAIAVNRAGMAKLTAEADLLRRRIRVIDETLAGLPEGYVSRRIAEREKAGYAGLQDRLLEVTRTQRELSVEITQGETSAGPVIALAGMIGWGPEKAATIFILLLVCVMEPLGLGLAVAVSAAWPATRPKTVQAA